MHRAMRTAAEKLAAEFSTLAGGNEAALELVQALHDGALAPTGPMGWIDVKISLALVRELLLRAGRRSASPYAVEHALKNVLALRADGIGWGRIAYMVGRGGGIH